MKLTQQDLDRALSDPRHLGSGYATSGDLVGEGAVMEPTLAGRVGDCDVCGFHGDLWVIDDPATAYYCWQHAEYGPELLGRDEG